MSQKIVRLSNTYNKKSVMKPAELAKEFAQISMKDPKASSRTSSCSSYSSQQSLTGGSHGVLAAPNLYQETYLENAIVDDEDTESTLNSPTLMATSVENNKLLPSLSTISLLSLNKDQLNDPNLTTSLSPDYKKKSNSRNQSSSHSRVSSFHHQRHPSFYYQQRRSSSMQQQQQQSQQSQQVPDTPNFGPTSLCGSPSGFYLNQTLPASLQRTHGFPPSLMRNNSASALMLMTSPRLNPTQTSEVPMTPLMLSAPPLEYEEDML